MSFRQALSGNCLPMAALKMRMGKGSCDSVREVMKTPSGQWKRWRLLATRGGLIKHAGEEVVVRVALPVAQQEADPALHFTFHLQITTTNLTCHGLFTAAKTSINAGWPGSKAREHQARPLFLAALCFGPVVMARRSLSQH